LLVREALRNRIHKFLWGEYVLCIAAVHDVSRERGLIAKVLLPRAAILAHPACPMKPGNANSVAEAEAAGLGTHLLNAAHRLMPRDHG
jgi:hypothetical protein